MQGVLITHIDSGISARLGPGSRCSCSGRIHDRKWRASSLLSDSHKTSLWPFMGWARGFPAPSKCLSSSSTLLLSSLSADENWVPLGQKLACTRVLQILYLLCKLFIFNILAKIYAISNHLFSKEPNFDIWKAWFSNLLVITMGLKIFLLGKRGELI